MKILVGNDWRSTAAGYAGSASSIAAALTTFLAVVAMQDRRHNWLWVILSAAVTCAATIVRCTVGSSQNYVQADPNIAPQVVNVATTGPVPDARETAPCRQQTGR